MIDTIVQAVWKSIPYICHDNVKSDTVRFSMVIYCYRKLHIISLRAVKNDIMNYILLL